MRRDFEELMDPILSKLARMRRAMIGAGEEETDVNRYITSRFGELMDKYAEASPIDLVEANRQEAKKQQTMKLKSSESLAREMARFIEKFEEEFKK